MRSREDPHQGYRPMAANWIRFYAASMAFGLEALHQIGYVYRVRLSTFIGLRSHMNPV